MVTENALLMSKARETLAGKWTSAIKLAFVYFLVAVVGSNVISFIVGFICGMFFGAEAGESLASFLGPVISFLLTAPMAFGMAYTFLRFSRNEPAPVDNLFYGFDSGKKYRLVVLATLFRGLITFLWTLLLIVPGIIAWCSYSQMLYILAEDDTLSPSEAMQKSKAMMNGNKAKYFFLGFRFIGWMILALFTLGIGFLWLFPYMQVTLGKFYDDVKANAASN